MQVSLTAISFKLHHKLQARNENESVMYGHSEYGIVPFVPVWQCLSLDSGQRRSCKFDEGVDPADEVLAKK